QRTPGSCECPTTPPVDGQPFHNAAIAEATAEAWRRPSIDDGPRIAGSSELRPIRRRASASGATRITLEPPSSSDRTSVEAGAIGPNPNVIGASTTTRRYP